MHQLLIHQHYQHTCGDRQPEPFLLSLDTCSVEVREETGKRTCKKERRGSGEGES